MKKWTVLLLAGILVSAFLAGCSKPEEGTPETSNTTSPDGKMEEKKDDAATPGTETKMDGGTAEGGAGETKMEGGAGEAGAGETKMEGGAGDTKMEEKKEG
jgi:hypothetical protein